MDNLENRREFARILTTAITEVEPVNGDMEDHHLTTETLDLSTGGILFCADKKFELGSKWKLKIRLEDSQNLNADWELKNFHIDMPIVTVVCEIVRQNGADEIGYEVAAKFISIDPDSVQQVESYLRAV